MKRESYEKHIGTWNRFLSSVKARLTVAQVVENVKSHAILTFDFIFLILISTYDPVVKLGLKQLNE
ncbi:hypothetical protein NQ317_015246 [Molorchus minor]|uniref:Uncharacterized protein n=1 Tax=Molorchus minor TaxID=1323400 RepID=A0ABQ9JPB4_9CUCU|nr:hypothetical protein NQ317_015246 [Molorchus minor]